MSERGILYIATGEDYITEARRSAKRAKEATKYKTALISHTNVTYPEFDINIQDPSPVYGFIDKPRNLEKTPFDQTIFLDTDTYVLDDISELFKLLEKDKLAVSVSATERALNVTSNNHYPDVPYSFPEYSTGVIVYKMCPRVKKLFRDWVSYNTTDILGDQLAFRKAVYESDIPYTAFSRRYNATSGETIHGPVKIYHDYDRYLSSQQNEEVEKILTELNKKKRPRTLFPEQFPIVPNKNRPNPAMFKIGLSLIRNGIFGTIKNIIQYVLKL